MDEDRCAKSKFPLGSSTSFSSTDKNEKNTEYERISKQKGTLTCLFCPDSFQDPRAVEMHIITIHKAKKEKVKIVMSSFYKPEELTKQGNSKHPPSAGTTPFSMNLTSTDFILPEISETVPNTTIGNIAEEYRKTNQNGVENVTETPSSKSNSDSIACTISAPATTLNTTFHSVSNNVKTSKNKNKITARASELTPNYRNPEMAPFQMNMYHPFLMNMFGMSVATPINMGMNMNAFANTLPPGMASPLINPFMAATFAPPLRSLEAMTARQQQLYQNQAPKKRRNRINSDQSEILGKHFDVKNAPTRGQIKELSDKTGLPERTVSYWYRNKLYRERQRDINSIYNFNNPPSADLQTDEYAKSNEIKDAGDKETNNAQKNSDNDDTEIKDPMLMDKSNTVLSDTKEQQPWKNPNYDTSVDTTSSVIASKLDTLTSVAPIFSPTISQDLKTPVIASSCNANRFVKACVMPLEPFALASFPETTADSVQMNLTGKQPGDNISGSRSKKQKTTYTSQQTEYLWQQYKKNKLPIDEDIENIACEISVEKKSVRVWFQNARAREKKSGFNFQEILNGICPFCCVQFKSRLILKLHLQQFHSYVSSTIDALCTEFQKTNLVKQESTSVEMSQTSSSINTVPSDHAVAKINSETSNESLLLSLLITSDSEVYKTQTDMESSDGGEQLFSASPFNVPSMGDINFSARKSVNTCEENVLSASTLKRPPDNVTFVKDVCSSPIRSSELNHSDMAPPETTDTKISEITETQSSVTLTGAFPLDLSIPLTCTEKINETLEMSQTSSSWINTLRSEESVVKTNSESSNESSHIASNSDAYKSQTNKERSDGDEQLISASLLNIPSMGDINFSARKSENICEAKVLSASTLKFPPENDDSAK